MAIDRERAQNAVVDFLSALGVDPESTELHRTPERVTDLVADMLEQAGVDPAEALGTPMEISADERTRQAVTVRDVAFRSICPHHLLPFEGTVAVSYLPDARLAGFSRIVKLVTIASRRFQLQERLGQVIAETMMRVLEPRGVEVRIEAVHGCVEALEPQGKGTTMVTVCRLGERVGTD